MYAIVEIAGKHYKVEKGGEVQVDLLGEDQSKKMTFDSVIVYRTDKDIRIGNPYVGGVTVEAEVVEPEVKGEKLTVFKYKHKTNYRVKTGHRQKYTTIKIKSISEKAKSEEKAAEKKQTAEA